jgi:hypothetical protein
LDEDIDRQRHARLALGTGICEERKFCHHCNGKGLRGGDWFTDGWNSFTGAVTNAANAVSNEFTNPNSVLRSGVTDAANKVANEFTNPDSLLRGTYLPEATQAVQEVTPFLQEIPGLGEVADAVDGVACLGGGKTKSLPS